MHMGNFKQKFWLSLILAIPVILFFTDDGNGISLPNNISWFGLARTDLSNYTIYLWRTAIFKRSKNGIETKSPAMMTLIAMGITVAYIYSVYSFYRESDQSSYARHGFLLGISLH